MRQNQLRSAEPTVKRSEKTGEARQGELMLSNLQISQTLNKNEGLMNTFRRTVSAEAMQFEWAEIQAAQQNPALFRPLYERYFEPIFQFIYNRTVNEDLTSDLCSQVFLKAMQRLGEYSFRGVPFSAWLFRIASNEIAQHYRQSQKRRVVAIEESHLGSMLDEMETFDFEKYRSALVQSLDQLREHDLEIVEMRFFEQRPFKEIAEFLDITGSNAKVRTYRVLDKLKKFMLEKLPNDQ